MDPKPSQIRKNQPESEPNNFKHLVESKCHDPEDPDLVGTDPKTCVAVLKSMVQPESRQTFQTGHIGNSRDRGSIQGEYLNNQKVYFHETNFKTLTHQFIIEAWNYQKSSIDLEVRGFTNWRFSSPSICK